VGIDLLVSLDSLFNDRVWVRLSTDPVKLMLAESYCWQTKFAASEQKMIDIL
jgi:hypothetical protein